MIFLLAKKMLKLLSKISAKKGYDFVSSMAEEDLIRNVNYLAHALRRAKIGGAGISLYPLRLAFDTFSKTVRRKKKSGDTLFGFEKWLSDNDRLIRAAQNGVEQRDFASLPHVNGVPRVVILADFLVKYSGGKVTYEKIVKVVEAFRSVTPLGYNELLAFGDAIAYRLLFELSLFAERSVHYYVECRRAAKEKFDRKRTYSDSYIHFYASAHPDRVSTLGREISSAILGFENLLADDEVLTSCYVNSLRELPRSSDVGRIVSLSPVNEVFSREKDYGGMSALAKNDYLEKCAELAMKHGVEETTVAQAALMLGERHSVHFGEILFHYPSALAAYLKRGEISPLTDERSRVQGGYAAIVLGVSLLIAAFPAYYLRNPWAYLSVLPLFIAVLHPVEYLLKRLMSGRVKGRPVPQMDYEKLPDNMSTVVVVSHFLASEEDAKAAFGRIETLAAGYDDPAISYVVLADLPSADRAWTEKDDSILDFVRNHHRSPSVSFLIRERVRCGNRFIAEERKRGAILDLFAAIREEDFSRFKLVGKAPKGNYAVLLDDDSEVLPGTIRAAILAMAHPLNRDYDLLSFGGRINRYSVKSHYGERFLRGCSVDAYPFYSDFYADAFDCALYCGKAIVRIGRYLEKLGNFFPNGRVLSHDIIEGAVLRSSSLKRCVYEDAPATFAADYQRTTRWQRGDVQLLPYAFCSRVRDRFGKRVPNPIAPIYKLVIFINGFSVLRDFMTAFVIAAAYFSGNIFLLYYAVSCHLFAKAYALILSVRTFFMNVRFSHALRGFAYSLELLTEEALMIPFRALGGAFVFFATCFKMATRSPDLLEWKPFRSTQGTGNAETVAKLFLPAVILLFGFMFFAGNVWVTAYVTLFLFYAFYLICSGRALRSRGLESKDEAILKDYASRIYDYFLQRKTGELPTDNIQVFPYETTASMTSPTNIGFALLAEVCAVKLGLVERETALPRIYDLISLVEGLEKWKGHLYNWYDVKTQAVKPPRIVSTVDSANLVACMIVLKEFLTECGDRDLADRVEGLVVQTDFTSLYDSREKCLAIVYHTEESRAEGRYDLLASESRLAYYFAIAQGVDAESYFRLGRDVVSLKGGNTLLSWSGTAFEYMLPRLFLRAPIGSLIAEQELRSAYAQISEKSEGVFGRSECGYAEFNDATAYRYKAVGCAALAMSEDRVDVIAPYAGFLYLPVIPRMCLSNLSLLRRLGAEGKYGFYEAIDFDHGEIVRSFMTHHQGMSLAAITNALCDDVLVELFERSPRVRSFRLLLAEENIFLRAPKRFPRERLDPPTRREYASEPRYIPDALVIRSGEYYAAYDALGRSYAKLGEFHLNKWLDYLPEKGGVFIQIKEGGEIYSPTYYPCGTKGCYAIFSDGAVRYVSAEKGLVEEVYPLDGYDGEMRILTVENPSDEDKVYTISAYVDAELNTRDAYDSHPAYSDMFVSTEYDGSTGTQYLYRKNAECERIISLSFSVKGLSELSVNSNRYNVIGRGGWIDRDYEGGVFRSVAPAFGDVLYPCAAATGKLKVSARSKGKVYFILSAASDLAVLRERNKRLDLAYRSGAIELLGRRGPQKTEVDLSSYTTLCGKLLFSRPSQESLSAAYAAREELGKRNLRDPILYLDVTEKNHYAHLVASADLSARLKDAGIAHVLTVVCDALTGAGMDQAASVRKILEERGAHALVVSESEKELFRSVALLDLSKLKVETAPPERKRSILPDRYEDGKLHFIAGEGGFTETGYAVRPFGERTLLPYSNVVGAERGGFVITESGGGFTFGKNAREDKITFWSGDAVGDPASESICLTIGEEKYRINGNNCEHFVGGSRFSHRINGVFVTVGVSLAASGSAKIYEIVLGGDLPSDARLSAEIMPALGWRYSEKVFSIPYENGYKIINAENGRSAYLAWSEGDCRFLPPKERSDPMIFLSDIPLRRGGYRFVIASEEIALNGDELALSKAKTLCEVSKSVVRSESGHFALDRLYNELLPYQVLSARLNAKTGFYQCSGAIGFRDQLQDCLALLLSDPARVREHILLCAAHQYEEGDVQHWWHPPCVGVRTRISDDRLWLVYLTSRYLESTADHSILDEEVPYLRSAPLATGEVSRYEIPSEGERAKLSDHLLRAIRVSLQKGEHGLLKIGSGDWNDGLDRVGVEGKGESVWLTMFACRVLEDAIPYFEPKVRAELSKWREELASALLPLLHDGRYPIAFADDGVWLGYPETKGCVIGLNPQTWAILCGVIPAVDAKRALSTAKELVDERNGIVKLSSPPFDRESNYGYIAAYPRGVRENGGQYTHAAVWYLKALLLANERDEAYRILKLLNPILRASSREKAERYMGEPYVLAGDVYGAEPYVGRAGWTWYTGSAGWLYHVLTEDFFGVRKRGDKLYVNPRFPSFFERCALTIVLAGKKIIVRYERSEEDALYYAGERVDYFDLREGSEEIELLCHFR